MIYIIVFLILALLVIFDLTICSLLIKKVFAFFAVLALIIISAIRWNTGPDWDSYFSFFNDYEKYRDGVYINMLEPGYSLLNGLVKSISTSYSIFLLFIAILTIGLKFFVFTKHMKIIFTLIFLYYCYYLADICSVRQFTALSFTLLSSIFIVKRKPLIFFILVALATTIHISSIAFFGAYWIYHQRFKSTTLIIMLIFSFIIGFLNLSGSILSKVIGLLGDSSIYADKLLRYNESGINSSNGNPYLSFMLGAVKRAVIVPVLFYFQAKVHEEDKDRYRGYLSLLIFGNMVYFLFIISFPEITRLSVSYLYFEIFLLGFVLVSIKDLSARFSLFIILLLFGAFRLFSFMAPFLDLYIPYKTFLEL